MPTRAQIIHDFSVEMLKALAKRKAKLRGSGALRRAQQIDDIARAFEIVRDEFAPPKPQEAPPS